MRTNEGAAPLLALALACSCATNPTPDDRRVSQEEAISSGKGAYAFVRSDGAAAVAGELIASGSGRLSVLTDHGGLVDVDFARVADLTLGVHDNDFGGIAAWTVLGSLSTISHGFFLIFSLPVWLASGIGAAANESHRGLFVCPANTRSVPPISMTSCLIDAAAYARFPQGLPPGVGAAQLLGRAPVAPARTTEAPHAPAPMVDGGAPTVDGAPRVAPTVDGAPRGAPPAPPVVPYDRPQ
jgi:hypothetical protein